MQEARFRPDMFGDGGQEGNDVVLYLPLDGVDAGDVETAALPHRLGNLFRDEPELDHSFGRIGLDLKPDLELGLRLP